MKRYRVIKPHQPECTLPLKVGSGTRLSFERRATHWAGWIVCTATNGSSGWVPESWVDVVDAERCVLKRDYDARELCVEPGQRLDGILEESGWLLAEMSEIGRGWVPLECVEELRSEEE